MKDVMEPFTNDNLPITFTFLHDNDTEHESKVVKG